MKKRKKKQIKRAAKEFAVIMLPYLITVGMIIYYVIFGY